MQSAEGSAWTVSPPCPTGTSPELPFRRAGQVRQPESVTQSLQHQGFGSSVFVGTRWVHGHACAWCRSGH